MLPALQKIRMQPRRLAGPTEVPFRHRSSRAWPICSRDLFDTSGVGCRSEG